MSYLDTYADEGVTVNPLDQIEDLMIENNHPIARTDDQELIMSCPGQWVSLHHIHILWHAEARVLHASCGLDMRVRSEQRPQVDALLGLVNQKLWIGHFEVCPDSHCVTFRHTLLLRGQAEASDEQIEDLMEIVVTECDRFHPTFQFVLWGNKSPAEALDASLLETVGEA